MELKCTVLAERVQDARTAEENMDGAEVKLFGKWSFEDVEVRYRKKRSDRFEVGRFHG